MNMLSGGNAISMIQGAVAYAIGFWVVKALSDSVTIGGFIVALAVAMTVVPLFIGTLNLNSTVYCIYVFLMYLLCKGKAFETDNDKKEEKKY